MGKLSVSESRSSSAGQPQPPAAASYVPAIDAHAQRLIARIKRNHRDTAAVLALRAHYETHGDFPSLVNLLEGWARTIADDRGAAEAFASAADAARRGVFADSMRAEKLLEQALARDPSYEPALTAFEVLLHERGDNSGLERWLSQITSELGRRDAPPQLRASVHYRLGQLYERSMLLPGRAIAQYRMAVELDPTLTPAIAGARSVYLAAGKAVAAADMFELEISATTDIGERHALLLALASHRHDALGDLEGAILALRRALRTQPGDLGTIAQLAERLRKRAGTDAHAEAEDDRARAAELYYQLARGVPRADAKLHLQACLGMQPEHERARRMLTELDAYGAAFDGERVPARPELSQVELDARATERLAPVSRESGVQARHASGRGTAEVAQPDGAPDEDVSAWLEDEHVTLLEDDVGTHRMVPLTDRPPPGPKV
jgi:tetratricopeptide (TPR) repeat protein